MMQDSLAIPTIRSRELDVDGNGIKESLELNMTWPLEDGRGVSAVSGVLLFYTGIEMEYSRTWMQSAAQFHLSTSGSASALAVDGALDFVQKGPLKWSKSVRDVYNYRVMNTSSIFAESYDMPKVFEAYNSRNETTVYAVRSSFWRGGRAAGQPFELSIRVRYDPVQACFEPGFWQELKWGWVQFLAILLPIYIFIEWWRQFVFGNQVIPTVVRGDPLDSHPKQRVD